jgi:hypothetical protein
MGSGLDVGGLTRFEIHLTRDANFGGASTVKGPWVQCIVVFGIDRQTSLGKQPEGI